MAMNFDLGRILNQYANPAPAPGDHVEQDFDQVASSADPEDLRQGVDEAFRSDQTPPFGSMVAQLFGQADPEQRTTMLNHLLSGLGPAVIGSFLGDSAGRAGGLGSLLSGNRDLLGGLLGRLGVQREEQVRLAPEQVERLRPEQVEQLANHAERENPGIIEHMADFYARNPALFKALGGAALAIALGKMARTRH
jgi:hypothetical protein